MLKIKDPPHRIQGGSVIKAIFLSSVEIYQAYLFLKRQSQGMEDSKEHHLD